MIEKAVQKIGNKKKKKLFLLNHGMNGLSNYLENYKWEEAF